MHRVLALLLASMLTACGVETATTAAASAEIKKREMDQAKQTMEAAKQRIEQTSQQIQQRAEDTDKAKD